MTRPVYLHMHIHTHTADTHTSMITHTHHAVNEEHEELDLILAGADYAEPDQVTL